MAFERIPETHATRQQPFDFANCPALSWANMALAGTDKKPLDTMATSPINAVEQPKLDQTSLVLELRIKCCGGIQSLLVDNAKSIGVSQVTVRPPRGR